MLETIIARVAGTVVALVAVAAVGGCATVSSSTAAKEAGMRIHYLEIVTPEVDAMCAAYAAANGLVFGEPDARLGNARTASLPDGGLVGVRAPLRASEESVVRPYWLVNDIDAALAAAKEAGVQGAMPPTEIPGLGKFAIYFQGGVQHGLWEK